MLVLQEVSGQLLLGKIRETHQLGRKSQKIRDLHQQSARFWDISRKCNSNEDAEILCEYMDLIPLTWDKQRHMGRSQTLGDAKVKCIPPFRFGQCHESASPVLEKLGVRSVPQETQRVKRQNDRSGSLTPARVEQPDLHRIQR